MANVVYTLFQGQGSEKNPKSQKEKQNYLIALPARTSGYRNFRDAYINHLEEGYEDYKIERETLNKIEAAQDFRWLKRTVRENIINGTVEHLPDRLSWSMKKLYEDYFKPASTNETKTKKKFPQKNKNVGLEPGRIFPYLELESSDSKYCHVCKRAQPLVRFCTKCARKCFYQCSVNLIYQQMGRCWYEAVADQVEAEPWLCYYCDQLEKRAIMDTETNKNLEEYYEKKPRKIYERCEMTEKCKSEVGAQYVTEKWELVCKTCGKLRPLTRACFSCHDWFTTPPPLNYDQEKPLTVFSIYLCVKCKRGVGDDVVEFDSYITKMKKDT